MVLFRGRYSDAIEPNIHYIMLEKDFSNVDEVLSRLDRFDDLEAMTERTYDHLVASGRFSYQAYMSRISGIIDEEIRSRSRTRENTGAPEMVLNSEIPHWLLQTSSLAASETYGQTAAYFAFPVDREEEAFLGLCQ